LGPTIASAAATQHARPKLAKELVELQSDVILALATALRQHTTLSIPSVFVEVPDPVAADFVMSYGADLSGVPRDTSIASSKATKPPTSQCNCRPNSNS
jgi:ABC-type uncharacterized transport system substrate-binding protein